MYKILSPQEIENKIDYFKHLDSKFKLNYNDLYFVVEKKKEIIGYAMLSQIDNNYFLDRIFIRENERFKSYGTKLINFIINNEIKKGNLVIQDTNEVITFFDKYGFNKKDGLYIIENIENKNNRQKEGKKTVLYSIFWNIVLAATKITAGFYGKSRALLTDGFNSLSDVFTSIGILLGIHFSSLPEDEDHPFGHEKIESAIGVGLGVVMILAAFELGKGGVEIILSGSFEATPQISTIFWAGFSSVVKFFMYRQKMRVGIKTNNAALIADARDSRNDVFSSLGVIVGIILSIFISPIFDTAVSIAVALLIFKEGVSVILETTNVILDTQDSELLGIIEEYIYENTDIQNVHDMMMRKSGDKIFLSLHIRVPKDISVFDAHKIADPLERSIKADFDSVKSVIIHVDYLMK